MSTKNRRKHILISGTRREPRDIMEMDWANLIVLDGCRYDYFSRTYDDYLSGKLKRAISPASTTVEWCNTVFQDRYDDIVYVSANPVINSKGISVGGFNAKEHFYKIIDIWDMGWDMSTIHPRELDKVARKARIKHPDKRLIIHYLQPHAPYFDSKEELPPRKSMYRSFRQISPPEEFRHIIGGKLRNILGLGMIWKVRKLLNISPNYMEAVWREQGKEGLRKGYDRNLRIVLKYVRQLVNKMPGKTVITADHGELLGDGNDYGHRAEHYVRPLVDVPWLEVDR